MQFLSMTFVDIFGWLLFPVQSSIFDRPVIHHRMKREKKMFHAFRKCLKYFGISCCILLCNYLVTCSFPFFTVDWLCWVCECELYVNSTVNCKKNPPDDCKYLKTNTTCIKHSRKSAVAIQ